MAPRHDGQPMFQKYNMEGQYANLPANLLNLYNNPLTDQGLLTTPYQSQLNTLSKVRFWIPVKIPIEYDNMTPRLPQNAKIIIP